MNILKAVEVLFAESVLKKYAKQISLLTFNNSRC